MTCADNSHRKTFVKMFSLDTSTTKMPPHGSLALSIPPPLTLPSATSTTTTSVLKYDYQEQQQLLSNSNDPFNNYTNTFDLSLLPQDHQTVDFNQTFPSNHTTPATILPAVQNNFTYILEPITPVTPPEIKIEQQWPAFISTNDIKQEHSNQSYYGEGENNKNQLQVPLFSNGIYPSPQSSPAQTEYQLKPPTTSSTGSPLNAATVTVKEEQFHILPPSPPESSYSETPSPIPSSTNGAPFSNDIKSEPFEADVDKLNDLSFLKIREPNNTNTNTNTASQQSVVSSGRNQSQQDYQVLREFLEDTTFQKKHNLKPLALDSIIGGIEEVPADIEPVIFLALQHVKREAEATCSRLQISHDPTLWSSKQAQAWLEATTQQFKLPLINNLHIKFPETGAALLQLSEEEFNRRVPECGSTLHAQLELWKLAYSDDYNKQQQQQQQLQLQQKQHNTYMATTKINTTITTTMITTRANQMEITVQEHQSQDIWNNTELTRANQQMEVQDESEDEECLLTNIAPNGNTCISTTTPTDSSNNTNESSLTTTTTTTISTSTSTTATPTVKRAGTRSGGSHIHLWQFLKELLATPQINGSVIRWLDRQKGIFKIEDSVRVAKLWGKRKNRPAMNYDKLSRSIRQYYKKGIMKKTERSQRLVYQFCQPYHK